MYINNIQPYNLLTCGLGIFGIYISRFCPCQNTFFWEMVSILFFRHSVGIILNLRIKKFGNSATFRLGVRINYVS